MCIVLKVIFLRHRFIFSAENLEDAEKVTCLTSWAQNASFCCLAAAAHTHILNAPDSTIFMRAFFSLLKPCVHEIETNCIQHHVQHYHLLTATAASPRANVYNFVPSAKWIEMGVIFPDLFSQLLSQFFRRPKIQCRAPNPKWNRRRDFSTWNKDAVSSHSG